MDAKQRVEVIKERYINTYAELWHTSFCLLEKGLHNPEGSFHQFLASLVFTAFTLEAYLNHIGPKLFKCWDDLERLRPKEKLNIIADRLQIDVDFGKRPWQVMKGLFGFRKDIAHGKSQIINTHEIELLNNKISDIISANFILTSWEKYCTEKNAIKAREDVKSIILAFHEAGKFDNDYPFFKGIQHGGSTIIDG